MHSNIYVVHIRDSQNDVAPNKEELHIGEDVIFEVNSHLGMDYCREYREKGAVESALGWLNAYLGSGLLTSAENSPSTFKVDKKKLETKLGGLLNRFSDGLHHLSQESDIYDWYNVTRPFVRCDGFLFIVPEWDGNHAVGEVEFLFILKQYMNYRVSIDSITIDVVEVLDYHF